MKPMIMQLTKQNATKFVAALTAGGIWLVAGQQSAGAAAAFAVDPAQSSVSISGTVAGESVQEQGAGSLTMHFAGTVLAELNGSSIQFPSGSRLSALDSGNWQPLPSGASGSAPANCGGKAGDALTRGVAAIRQFEVTFTSGVLTITDGRFDAQSLVFTTPADASGSLDYRVDGLLNLAGSIGLAGYNVTGVSSSGTLTTSGAQQVLTIPINYTLVQSLISENDTRLNLVGQLVAVSDGAALRARGDDQSRIQPLMPGRDPRSW